MEKESIDESILKEKIELWVCSQYWAGDMDVSGTIAETNGIYNEVDCESIKIKPSEKDNQVCFDAKVSLSGEARKDDVPWLGEIIDIHISGVINLTFEHKIKTCRIREQPTD